MTDSKIFIDTAPFIYILDNHPEYRQATQNFIRQKYLQKSVFITSILTFMEYTVKPKQMKDNKAVESFNNFLTEIGCQLIPINFEIADIGSDIRAKYPNIKAFDALQVATALHTGCNQFVTNDKQLKQISEIEFVVISELAK
jgi:predicted nucleic acid-binding protein